MTRFALDWFKSRNLHTKSNTVPFHWLGLETHGEASCAMMIMLSEIATWVAQPFPFSEVSLPCCAHRQMICLLLRPAIDSRIRFFRTSNQNIKSILSHTDACVEIYGLLFVLHQECLEHDAKWKHSSKVREKSERAKQSPVKIAMASCSPDS